MSASLLLKLSLFLGISLTGLPCAAQEKQITNVRFVTFPVLTGGEAVELIVGDGKTTAIELPTNSLSKPYQIENIRKCTLGKTVTDDEGKASFTVYGQTAALTSKEQIILVIRKGAKLSDGLELTAFDSSQKGFGGGKYFLMNASNVDIAGKIGSSTFKLTPNKHTLLAPKPSKVENNRKYLYTEIHFRKGDLQRPFYTSTWRFSENARCMVFFHHDENSKQLRTHTIRHYTE